MILLSLMVSAMSYAERWTTYFAYNNVVQIASTPDRVYAISDGSLFSVDKQSERVQVYNSQSGLHSTGITCIHYDQKGKQLIIAYGTGKMDVITSKGVKYLSELYEKDMTQRKTIYNITISGRMAYLSTHYGVQTMDLKENKLVDSYWLRPGGEETPVKDVLLTNDSIYAFTDDSLFCASKKSNLVDYHVWKRELRTGRISPDANKGVRIEDDEDIWVAGHEEGIVRYMKASGERIPYKPEGPATNIPYHLTCMQGEIWMLQGGRWASQYDRPGVVMHYDGSHWVNIQAKTIQDKTGTKASDFVNVAVDPHDKSHYFVTSFGTGLYEFRNDELVHHYLPAEDNTITSAVPSNIKAYTRLDNAQFDNEGNLWFINASGSAAVHQLACLDASGEWHGVQMKIGDELIRFYTPAGLIMDNMRPNYKWIATARYNTFICLLDDNGTRFDNEDDKIVLYTSWMDQHGRPFTPERIYAFYQDQSGRVWMCTEQGVAYIDVTTDYFSSNNVVRPELMDHNGENPLAELAIKAMCETPDGTLWFGTENIGFYAINHEITEFVGHYTTGNSAMPSNNILSLTCTDRGILFIGTDEGLVEYAPKGIDEGLTAVWEDEEHYDLGSMNQWRLHFAYSNPQELEASPKHVYAIADGALFSYNRTDGELEYWNKSTGLNGTTIAHIAYDKNSERLIIAYEDGRIDLLGEDGSVVQMPDLLMKAGSIASGINGITVGSKYCYLAMPFGILTIDPQKAEIRDTYYIGDEAAMMDISHVVELGDSLYAFGEDKMYTACLNDNLVDYHYWHLSPVSTDGLQNAVAHRNQLYTQQNDSLYRWEKNQWRLVRKEKFRWIHASGDQMLVCVGYKDLYHLGDDDKLNGLTDRYSINDAIYSQGEYWLGEINSGLVLLSTNGDEFHRPSGPNSNFGYSLCTAHGQIYATIGGRWASQFGRPARINIYNGSDWISINEDNIYSALGVRASDAVSIAVDSVDPGHFFVATYGSGVYEFRDYAVYHQHTAGNSTIQATSSGADPRYYTRTDGAYMDKHGNFWVLNSTSSGQPIHVLSPDGIWHALAPNAGYDKPLRFYTPGPIWADRRNSDYKWLLDLRYVPTVTLFYDGGTPTKGYDDHCMSRSTFVDQNGTTITPTYFYCLTQDHKNRIWLGTEKGILLLDANTDFFTSNACRRIIIPRNDGTGLGDYLLGDEQIRCMAPDGGNRMWIGTESSGLYLIEDDTITVAHFTEANSLLPSNSIQSIVIEPKTGDVFVGTDKGIASYRGDASEPSQTMDNAYAYPNPVRPDYGGMITITNLMDNTTVNIIDSGGNLVCKTRSHGGTATWDGKLPDGRRATSGVYTALCNTEGGHAAVKILFISK